VLEVLYVEEAGDAEFEIIIKIIKMIAEKCPRQP